MTDGDDIIPVEVKSSHAPTQPYASLVLQLAACCLLVEECYHTTSSLIIKYAGRALKVDYTRALEDQLAARLNHMRDALAAGDASCRHREPRRCQACGYRRQSDRRLTSAGFAARSWQEGMAVSKTSLRRGTKGAQCAQVLSPKCIEARMGVASRAARGCGRVCGCGAGWTRFAGSSGVSRGWRVCPRGPSAAWT